jgi:hypothetical protein
MIIVVSPVGLTVKSLLENMDIGDCIPCRYTATSGAAGTFSELGTCVATEIPISGTVTPDGLFYFIKIDKGILVADRVIQTNISWNVLNAAKYIEGVTPQSQDYTIVSPRNMTGYNTPSPYVVTVSAVNGTDYGWKAFDDGTITRSIWYTTSTPPSGGHWLKIYLGEKKKVTDLFLGNFIVSGASYSVKDYELYGSNDNIDFTLILKGTQSNVSSYSRHSFDAVEYSYYRLNLLNSYYASINNVGVYQMALGVHSSTMGNNVKIRSLSGGNAYLGTDGKASLAYGSIGAYPINNEWDRYIVKSDLGGKISPGDNNIWNWKDTVFSWCDDTLTNGFVSAENGTANNSWRAARCDHPLVSHVVDAMNGITSSHVSQYIGFRPVLEYPDDHRCTNAWY